MILPIGTIVYLSGGNQKVMISNREFDRDRFKK